MASSFAVNLKNEIEAFARDGRWASDWRLLYSPSKVLDDARVAFIGLNPGGAGPGRGQAEFAPEHGSAYVTETWGRDAAGKSKLQQQVRELFKLLDVAPEKVLAGNLVPFRSRDWADLPDKRAALKFGENLWRSILVRARPNCVVTMGRPVFDRIAGALGAKNYEEENLGWGSVKGRRANFAFGTVIGLPHLSRFAVIGRETLEPGLARLFAGQRA